MISCSHVLVGLFLETIFLEGQHCTTPCVASRLTSAFNSFTVASKSLSQLIKQFLGTFISLTPSISSQTYKTFHVENLSLKHNQRKWGTHWHVSLKIKLSKETKLELNHHIVFLLHIFLALLVKDQIKYFQRRIVLMMTI